MFIYSEVLVMHMRVIKKILDKPAIKLVPLGDIHLGHAVCDKDLFENTINYIAENDEAMWIGMGDYCDAISAKDKRYNPKEIDSSLPTPDVQYREVTKMLMPIKDKCLGLLDGNHDYTHWTHHNHNYVDQMAHELETEYLGLDAVIRLIFPRTWLKKIGKNREHHKFDIFAHHGWSSGRSDGYKVKSIQDMALIFSEMNLYLMGHVHLKGEAPVRVKLNIAENLDIIQHTQRYVFTGSYIKGYVNGFTTYIEGKALPPTQLGSPSIFIKSYHDCGKTRKKHGFTVNVSEIEEIDE